MNDEWWDSAKQVPRLGIIRRISSRRWKFCGSFFRALEKMESIFPDLGRNRSEGWNNSGLSFQRLEEFRSGFPSIGKIRRLFSRGWKFCGPFFQTLEEMFPDIGKFGTDFSKGWNFSGLFFQGLENLPRPRQGRPKAGPQQRPTFPKKATREQRKMKDER